MDFLGYGAGRVKAIGFRTIKLEFSIAFNTTKYPNTTFGSPTTLKQLAQEAAFAAVFADSGFDRYVLTCFSITRPENNPWAYAWDDTNGDTQEQEIYDLAHHLATTYPTKEFIIQNWEGDWQLLNSFNPKGPIPRSRLYAYRDYHRRRQNAVRKALADAGQGTVKYAIECNRVLDDYGYRVHRDVLKNINPDMVFLSSYETIEGWQQGLNQAQLEADIAAKLTSIVNRVRAELPTTPIALGEWGFPLYNPGFAAAGYNVGNLIAAKLSAADALGIVGQIYWQIIDNEEQSPGVPYGFGLHDRNGNSTTVGPLSAAGSYFDALL
jgi:hypothetical protein